MNIDTFTKLMDEAIRLANLAGNAKYWKIILIGSIEQYFIGKYITTDKSWE